MGSIRAIALLSCLVATIGCRSPYVEATVTNHTNQSIDLIEVDYPSASFGTQSMVPGSSFHYRFKVLGSGDVKLTYTTSTFRDKTSKGPTLKEGDEGQLQIAIAPDGVHWQFASRTKHP
jgi:hypothetical protein